MKKLYFCNTIQQEGEFVCTFCGTHLQLEGFITLPPCPTCGNGKFTKY